MIHLETRSFETRFGGRCPFCNKSWGDPSPCGDSRADWSIERSLKSLFADRVANCDICDRAIPGNRTFCETCSQSRQAARNRGDRHLMIKAECQQCGGPFERRSDKKQQKYCSLSCGNRARKR